MNQISRRTLFAAASTLAIGIGAAGAQTAMPPAANAPMPTGSQAVTQPRNVIDSLAAAGNFDAFIEMVSRAGMVDDLKGAGPFTLLAPTNAAIGRLPAQLRDTLNPTTTNSQANDSSGDRLRLRAFIDMHIIPGRFTLSQLADRTTQLRTMNGNMVEIVSQAGQEYRTRIIGNSGFGVGGINAELRPTRFIVPEIIASNGVVLPIDVALIQ